MKILVHTVEASSAAPFAVTFSCAAGEGRARWSGATQPVPGATYDAELDVDDVIEIGRNAIAGPEGNARISLEGGHVAISGEVEARDDDGMVYLRLAADCLLMVESEDDLSVGQHIRLSLASEELEVTPFGE